MTLGQSTAVVVAVGCCTSPCGLNSHHPASVVVAPLVFDVRYLHAHGTVPCQEHIRCTARSVSTVAAIAARPTWQHWLRPDPRGEWSVPRTTGGQPSISFRHVPLWHRHSTVSLLAKRSVAMQPQCIVSSCVVTCSCRATTCCTLANN